MLVISRKSNETLMLGDKIEIRVLGAKSDSVRLGIVAPREVSVVRGELVEKVREQNLAALNLDAGKLQAMAARSNAQSKPDETEMPRVEIPGFEPLRRLTSWMVHDVRNFLTPIHGELQLCLLDCPEGEVRNSLEIVHNHLSGLKAWLQDTSALGRTASISRDTSPLIDAFRDTANRWKGAAALELDCCPSLELQKSQPGLSEILSLLAENAEEALATAINISAQVSKGRLQITVKDNGTGIDRSTLEQLKTPLHSTKSNHKGRGLFLARIWSACFSGRLFVSSRLGWGTEVTLDLGLPAARLARKPCMVIVSDSFRGRHHKQLEEFGFKVLLAQSPREMELLKTRFPEAPVFDPTLEELDDWLNSPG